MKRPWIFFAGVVVVLAAVLSPLEELAAEYFSAHMAQHLALVLVAAPLIAVSRVVSIPSSLRSVALVAVAHAIAMWAWHLPAAYDAAMENPFLHLLEHASFLMTAVLFWDVTLDRAGDRFKRLGLVFATMLQSGALGAVIAFTPTPLYEWHVSHGSGNVLNDQQLAGVIMWVPPGVVYLAVMVGLLARALSAFDAAEQS